MHQQPQSMSTHRDQPATTIELGVVVKPHGVRGLVKIWLHNPGSTALDGCRELILEQDGDAGIVGFSVVAEAAKGGLVVELEGVSSVEQARTLRGAKILLPREALQAPDDDEYLYVDLVGCQVLDEGDRCLGRVREVFEAGASDVLVVRGDGQERMIPMVEPWIQDVDLARKVIRVQDADQWEPYSP